MKEKNGKVNKLHTKYIPAFLMLLAAAIAIVICLIGGYELRYMLISVFAAMLVFFFIGMVIKSVVDRFNMKVRMEDYFKNQKGDSGSR
ncbi:MAG: hypothetical protein MJ105_07700 [Lachnospiraceae bacterium]|nr:hypothetical protein [Lachnospiraceae bacterium]